MPPEPQENVDFEAILKTGIDTNEKVGEVSSNTEGQLIQQIETNKKLEEVTDAVDIQTQIIHKNISEMAPSMEALGKAMTFASTLMEKLEGPQGPEGKQGPKGDKGDTGPAGKDAHMRGPKGEDGRDGVDGKDGKDGKPGPKGPMGPSGKDGKDGKDGAPGKDGKDAPIDKIIAKLQKEAQKVLDDEVTEMTARVNRKVASKTYSVGELEGMQTAVTGQVPMKQSDGTWSPQTVAGTGDMAQAVYDPTNVADDAFDMENMVEGATKKILTAGERTKLSNLSGTNTGDQTITNSSDATSHTVTLSASGGSVQLIEGTNITLTTGGTGSAGTVTIAATGGSGDVTKVGTPVDNQVGVWTGNGTIEGDAGFTFDGGLGITVADAENKVGLTINQNDKTNYVPAIELNTSGDQYHPAVLNYYNSYAGTVGQDGDIGTMSFYGKDSAGNKTRFAFFYAGINDNTDTQEDGQFQISVVKAGTSRTLLDMYGNGVNGIYVGSSAVGPGVVSSAGSQDLTLQTGNATTGNITIVDGADGAITIAPNGAGTTKVDGTLTPVTTNDGALGTAALQWEDLFLAEGGVINWDNGDVTLTQTGNVLAVSGGDLQVATAGVGTNADSVPTLSSTNTLTNKRVTPRAGTTTSSATPTINTDNYDYYSLTAQTVDITSFTTNLSGTPTDGQKLWISVTGTGARAITWGASFEASTIALPTTTVTTNRLDVGFVWNTATSKWRCVASA